MEIDLGNDSDRGYDVKLNGQTYRLREPNVEDTELLVDAESQGSQIKAFLGFIVRLGLPEDVAKKLSVAQIQILSAGLSPKMDEKKS